MPKYERFDNNLTTIITTTPSTSPASTPPATPKPPLTTTTTMMTTTDDDDDESFAMFIGNNHSIHNNSNNNNINEIHGSNYNRHNGSSGNQTNNNYNNKNNYNSNSNFYGNNHYSNDNHYTSHSNSNNNNHNIINNSNLMNTSNNNYNNNNSSSNNHLILDHDESTMEVPLLNNNNNCSSNNHNDPDYDDPRRVCRCEQPGFSADLSSKTTQEAKLKILLAISLCCIFMIIEFLGGYLAGSLAIMTDAAHLASDCISFVIGLVAIWLGSRPPDRQMSFGYKRTEVMGAIVSILSIWILTATLVMVAIERLYSNDFDLDANTMMTISGIGILINIVMAFILHGSSLLPGGSHGHSHAHSLSHGHSHSHTHMGHSHTHASGMHNALMDDDSDATGNGLKHIKGSQHSEKNLNLRAAMIHVIGDLVQSIGVFVASIVIKFVPSAKFADPLCTLLFSVIVIMTTVGLFKESIGILMDAVPLEVSLANLERDLEHIEGVKSVHHLNVWSHTSNHNVMMVHLVIDLLSDSNTVLDRARHLAQSHKYNIKHSTIQIERLPA